MEKRTILTLEGENKEDKEKCFMHLFRYSPLKGNTLKADFLFIPYCVVEVSETVAQPSRVFSQCHNIF